MSEDMTILYGRRTGERRALLRIARSGCESFVAPATCAQQGRTPGAYFADEGWCSACLARAALDGVLPMFDDQTKEQALGRE